MPYVDQGASGLRLEIPGGETAGGLSGRPSFDDPIIEERIGSLLAKRGSLRVEIAGEGDVEGHLASNAVQVRLRVLDDEDDTEGHAISLRFPSVDEAKAFRNQLLATGLIAGALVAGGAAGLAVSQGLGQSATGAGSAAEHPGYTEGYPSTAGGLAGPSQLTPAAEHPGYSEGYPTTPGGLAGPSQIAPAAEHPGYSEGYPTTPGGLAGPSQAVSGEAQGEGYPTTPGGLAGPSQAVSGEAQGEGYPTTPGGLAGPSHAGQGAQDEEPADPSGTTPRPR
jgi:hypothetical protein